MKKKTLSMHDGIAAVLVTQLILAHSTLFLDQMLSNVTYFSLLSGSYISQKKKKKNAGIVHLCLLHTHQSCLDTRDSFLYVHVPVC